MKAKRTTTTNRKARAILTIQMLAASAMGLGMPVAAQAAVFNWNVPVGTWDTTGTNWTPGGAVWDSVTGPTNDAILGNGGTANVSGNVFARTTTLGGALGNNVLNVAGGATVTSNVGNARLNIGDTAGGNSVVVSTPGTSGAPSYTLGGSSNQLNIGISSSNNSLTVQNGAYIRVISGGGTNTWNMGQNAGANNNSILVTGNGSTIDRGGAGGSSMNVGVAGDGNNMTISAGGLVIPRRLGIGTNGGDNNFVRVTGVGSTASTLLVNDSQPILEIGRVGGTGNFLQIDGGAVATFDTNQNRGYMVGPDNGSNNNYILVDGVGSTFTLREGMPLAIGGIAGQNNANHTIVDSTASGNHFDIFNGAKSFQNTVFVQGVNSAVNLGNGTGISELEVRHSNGNAIYGAGIVLDNADSKLNINDGRLIAGTIGGTSTNLVSGLGQVVLVDDAFFSQSDLGFNRTISSQITGTGDFFKEGAGELLLTSGLNNYTGNTSVMAGILELQNSFLADAADVVIAPASALIDLTFAGIDDINAFSIDGGTTYLVPGIYGAGNLPGFITGSGQLRVRSQTPNNGGGNQPPTVGVPEPATASLLGLAGLLGLRRRNRTA